MSKALMICGGALAVVAVTTLLWRRCATPPARYAWLRRSGWNAYPRSGRAVLSQLNSLALLQVGHNQRCRTILQPAGPEMLALYQFETGAEHRRTLHEWTVVAHDSDHRLPRAVMTRQDWMIAVASSPVAHVFSLEVGGASHGPQAADAATAGCGPWALIVEDPDAWPDRLRRNLGDWLAPQPVDRTWEILPDAIVGYQPARASSTAATELLEASKKLARELTDQGEQESHRA